MNRVRFVLGVASISLTFLMSACGVTAQYKRNITLFQPMSELTLPKDLKLEIPSGAKKAAESFMIAFVEPNYAEEATRYEVDPNTGQLANRQGRYKKSDMAKTGYFETVRRSLKSDLESMLLKKGVRVLGTFKTRDELTFDNKKRAMYVFTPIIKLVVDEEAQVDNKLGNYKENGVITIRGYIEFWLRESITGEKLWVKRLEAPIVSKPYEFVARFKEPTRLVDAFFMMGEFREKDSSDKALTEALSEFYAKIGQKLWDHIDPEEWEKYLAQAANLRGEKRY